MFPRRSLYRFPRGVIAAVLVAAALGAAVALAISPDDEIPGVPLPPSPFVGSLVETGNPYAVDRDDVYHVPLATNELFEVTLTVPPNADFDIYLLPPRARSVEAAKDSVAYSESTMTGGVESFSYVSDRSVTATFFLDIWAYGGAGDYTVHWRRAQLPTPVVNSTVPSVAPYGGSVAITGTLRVGDAPMSGFRVEALAKPDGGSTWTRAALTTTTPSGGFTLAVRPAKRTQYRIKSHWSRTTGGDAVGYGLGPVMTVSPRAHLTFDRAPGSAIAKRAFTVGGTLKPAHASGRGHVKVEAWKPVTGRGWVLVRSFPATHARTAWSARVELPSKGVWRLEATVPADGLHAKTTSSARTVRVSSR